MSLSLLSIRRENWRSQKYYLHWTNLFGLGEFSPVSPEIMHWKWLYFSAKRIRKMSLRCKFSVLPVELRPFSLAGVLEGCSCCPLVKPRKLLFFQPHFWPFPHRLIRINSARSLFWDQHIQQFTFCQAIFSYHNMRKISKKIWTKKYSYSIILEAYF